LIDMAHSKVFFDELEQLIKCHIHDDTPSSCLASLSAEKKV
jgi:hypothetical protein